MKTISIIYGALLVLLTSLATQATIPLPDMILHGQLFDESNQRITVESGNVIIEVKINASSGQSDPVIASAELETSEEPNAGDIYILRIPREDGDTPVDSGSTVIGDTIHITINGVEVTETVSNGLMVNDNFDDVQTLDLHLASILPPRVSSFSVTDPTETTAGFTNQRDVDVDLVGSDIDSTIDGWLITTTDTPPAANDPNWLSSSPSSFTLSDQDKVYTLFAWVRDSSNLISTLHENSAVSITLDRTPPVVSISSPITPLTTQNSLFSLQGTVVDTNELHSVEANVNGTLWQAFSTSVSWVFPATLQLGTNIVDFRATDRAGNVSSLVSSVVIFLESSSTGSIQVTLLPDDAVNNGAQWKIIGRGFDSGFQSSEDVLEVISVGTYTLIFRTVLGWNQPQIQKVTITSGQKIEVFGTYTKIVEATALFDIPLKFGWNFISIPIAPLITDVNNLLQGASHGFVWFWNGSHYENVTTLEAGKGYWVYHLGNPTTVTIQGNDISGSSIVALGNNWNTVGPIIGPDDITGQYESISFPLTSQAFSNTDRIKPPVWYWDGLRFQIARQLEAGRGYLIFIGN